MNDVWCYIAKNYIKDLETSTALRCVCKAWQQLHCMDTVGKLLRESYDAVPGKYKTRWSRFVHAHRLEDISREMSWQEAKEWLVGANAEGMMRGLFRLRKRICAEDWRDIFETFCRGPKIYVWHRDYIHGPTQYGPVQCHVGIKWMMQRYKKIVDREAGFLAACENGDIVTAVLVRPRSVDRVKSRAMMIAERQSNMRIIYLLAYCGVHFGRRDFIRICKIYRHDADRRERGIIGPVVSVRQVGM